MGSKLFDFDEALSIEAVYEPPEDFLKEFYAFHGQLVSIQRYFYFGDRFFRQYLIESRRLMMRSSQPTEDWVLGLFHDDITLQDMDFLLECHNRVVLVHLFALAEGLFADVAKEVMSRLRCELKLTKNGSTLDKYFNFLRRECGLELQIPKWIRSQLHALRELRNQYTHSTKELSPDVLATLESIHTMPKYADSRPDDAYVFHTFFIVGQLATFLHEAYWKRFDEFESN